MKFRSIFFFAVLYVLFSIPASLIGQAGLAGPDRYICPGGTTSIGNADLCRKCCTVWSPATGLSDPGSMHTEVNGIMNTTQYILHYTTAEGDLIADTVMVFVNTIDITLHKPAFIDPAESAIPAAQALQQGAQTMVNLDDDDGDLIQDDGDMSVSDIQNSKYGDNEFIKIKITLRNSGTATGPSYVTGSLNHEAGSNAGSIRFWKSMDKSMGAYTPGDTLHLQKNDSISYSSWLWIEGVSPHSMQKEAQFSVIFNDPTGVGSCKSAPVGVTIIGIQQITWSGNGNGYTGGDGRNDANTLDFKNGSYRIFPEAKMGLGSVKPSSFSRDSAILNILLTVNPIDSIPLFIRLIDIDDPSASILIDPNDFSTATGQYVPSDSTAGAPIIYTPEFDNRDNSLNNKSKSGILFGATQTGSLFLGLYRYNCTSKNQQFYVKVSAFPGDNYCATVYGDRNYVLGFKNIDKYHGASVVFVNGVDPTQSMNLDPSLVGPVLTCWRTLHVEYDLMRNPKQIDNEVKGYFNSFESINHYPYKFTLTNKILGVKPQLSDNSYPGKPRFKYGTFLIGSPAINVCDSTSNCVAGNAMNEFALTVARDLTLNSHLEIELKKPTSSAKKYNIKEIEPVTTPIPGFIITLAQTPPANELSIFQNGNASIAGGKECINCVHIAGGNQIIIKNDSNNQSNLNIPFTLRDDDLIPATGASTLISPVSLSLSRQIYEKVYLDVCNDGGGNTNFNQNNLLFIRNVNNVGGSAGNSQYDPYSGPEMDILKIHQESYSFEKSSYWVSYLISGWQHSTRHDFDANGEAKSLNGLTSGIVADCIIAPGGEISLLYHETAREIQPSQGLAFTAAHELGHQLGLSHGDTDSGSSQCAACILPMGQCPNMGLMTDGIVPLPDQNIVEFHQNVLRCRVYSPGNINK